MMKFPNLYRSAQKVLSALLGVIAFIVFSYFALALSVKVPLWVAAYIVAPGTVYVPTRLLMGASLVPKENVASHLFFAWLRGFSLAFLTASAIIRAAGTSVPDTCKRRSTLA